MSTAFSLQLNQYELDLIAKYVSITVLGNDDEYKQAAFSILEKITNEFGDSYLHEACHYVNIMAAVPSSDMNAKNEYSAMILDDELVLNVSKNLEAK